MIKWDSPCQKVFWSVCTQRRLRSACKSPQSEQGLAESNNGNSIPYNCADEENLIVMFRVHSKTPFTLDGTQRTYTNFRVSNVIIMSKYYKIRCLNTCEILRCLNIKKQIRCLKIKERLWCLNIRDKLRCLNNKIKLLCLTIR